MLIINCPHCDGSIIIIELNCKIFRHGVFKNTGNQIGPHSSKEECDQYIKQNLIYGCGKPFQIIEDNTNNDNKYKAVICDYI